MRSSNDERFSSRDYDAVLHQLGLSISVSMEVLTQERMPGQMALLLLRLALVEVIKRESVREEDEARLGSLVDGMLQFEAPTEA